MGDYRGTLHKWASRHVPEGATVTGVDIQYDDGYDPTFTAREPSMDVSITYRMGEDSHEHMTSPEVASTVASIGELLTELFAIEDAQ